jgi:two-component system response regulator PilR (NtrC family)
LRLPSLRERLDDIGLLAEAILQRLASPGTHATLSAGALQALRSYAFPGNVRELENILERALAFANDGVIEVADLALRPVGAPGDPGRPAHEATSPASAEMPVAQTPVPAPAPQPSLSDKASPSALPGHLDNVEREIIRQALARAGFDRGQAAELLGISARQLRYRMQRLSILEPE